MEGLMNDQAERPAPRRRAIGDLLQLIVEHL
jgi:hypothetical protein